MSATLDDNTSESMKDRWITTIAETIMAESGSEQTGQMQLFLAAPLIRESPKNFKIPPNR